MVSLCITVLLVEQDFHLVFELFLQRLVQSVDGGLVGEFTVHKRARAAAVKQLVDVVAEHGAERRAAVNYRRVHYARVRQHETAA